MTPKDILIQELDNASDPLIVEVLDFLQFLKSKREQGQQTSSGTLTFPASAHPDEHSASTDYQLQGKEPYRYDGPFEPAIPLEEWDASGLPD